MNKIAVIALSGLAISAVCLGIAAAIGTKDFRGGAMNFSMFDGEGDCQSSNSTATSRTLAWDGGDSVTVSVPVTLHYKPGTGQMVEVTGDPEMLSHLRIKDGTIEMNCHFRGWNHRRLDITLPGRVFNEYHLEGLATLDLQQLAQEKLKISIAGSGDVTATGTVGEMKMEIAGRGDAKMKDLAVKTLNLDIAGRGDVETSPSEKADIEIAGSGTVKLYTEPKHIETSIMGAGNIEHLAGKS